MKCCADVTPDSDAYALQGSIVGTSSASKSRTFRVAKVRDRICAVAAMSASKSVTARPRAGRRGGEFGFDHVKPASVLGRVMPFEPSTRRRASARTGP